LGGGGGGGGKEKSALAAAACCELRCLLGCANAAVIVGFFVLAELPVALV